MVKIPPLVLLFLIQFLLIFLGLTIFLFFKYRKLSVKEIIARGEINRLKSDIKTYEKQNEEVSSWKDMFNNLEIKFKQIKEANAKLKKSIDLLIPKAERSKEQEKTIRDIEESYVELDAFLVTMREEKARLLSKAASSENEISKLSEELEQSVSKDKYDNLEAENKRLEMKLDKLKNDLNDKTKELDSLQKNFIYLEKEYNALYKDLKGEKP